MTKFEQRITETWPDAAPAVLALFRGDVEPGTYASVEAWARQCYTPPSHHDRFARALNEALGAHGVEAVFAESDASWPVLEYLNMGDTYAATLVWRASTGRWRVASMGDEVERLERHGMVTR